MNVFWPCVSSSLTTASNRSTSRPRVSLPLTVTRAAPPSICFVSTGMATAYYSNGASPMNVILFGATGMVGQGVLCECLLDTDVCSVLAIGRSATGRQHEKLRELVHKDLLNYSAVESRLSGFDACFFCLGVTWAGMRVVSYPEVSYCIAIAAAEALVKLNPGMTFIYVSGMGTDSTGRGRTMWARVKGQTENGLLRLPFKAVFLFRPGFLRSEEHTS